MEEFCHATAEKPGEDSGEEFSFGTTKPVPLPRLVEDTTAASDDRGQNLAAEGRMSSGQATARSVGPMHGNPTQSTGSDSEGELPEFTFGTTNQLRMPDLSGVPRSRGSSSGQRSDASEFTFGATSQARMPDVSHLPLRDPNPRSNDLCAPDFTFGTTNQLQMPDLSHVPRREPSPGPHARCEVLRAAGQGVGDTAPMPGHPMSSPNAHEYLRSAPDARCSAGGASETPVLRRLSPSEPAEGWSSPVTHLPGALIPARPPTPPASAVASFSKVPALAAMQVPGWPFAPGLLQTPANAGQHVLCREATSGSVSEISWSNVQRDLLEDAVVGHHSHCHDDDFQHLADFDPSPAEFAWGYAEGGHWYDLEHGDGVSYAAAAVPVHSDSAETVQRVTKMNKLADSIHEYNAPMGAQRMAAACFILWLLVMAIAVLFFLVQTGTFDFF